MQEMQILSHLGPVMHALDTKANPAIVKPPAVDYRLHGASRCGWRFSGRRPFGSAATCRRFRTRRQVVEFIKADLSNITNNFGMHGSLHPHVAANWRSPHLSFPGIAPQTPLKSGRVKAMSWTSPVFALLAQSPLDNPIRVAPQTTAENALAPSPPFV